MNIYKNKNFPEKNYFDPTTFMTVKYNTYFFYINKSNNYKLL